MATLREYLSALASDRKALGAYIADPEAAVGEAQLSEEDSRALLSRDANQINRRLMAEDGESPVPMLVVSAEDIQRLAPGGPAGLSLVPTSPLTLPIQLVSPQITPLILPQVQPQIQPLVFPQLQPQVAPVVVPQVQPQVAPQVQPQIQPLVFPQLQPQVAPVVVPQVQPQIQPLVFPQLQPQVAPVVVPQVQPQIQPIFPPQQQYLGQPGTARAPVTTPVSVPPFTPDPPLMITNIPPLTIGALLPQASPFPGTTLGSYPLTAVPQLNLPMFTAPGGFTGNLYSPGTPLTVNAPNSPVMFQLSQPRFFG